MQCLSIKYVELDEEQIGGGWEAETAGAEADGMFVNNVLRKRKDYAIRRQFNEKPSIKPGCPVTKCLPSAAMASAAAVSVSS